MFVLHVDLEVKPGARQALEKIYAETFRPAISRQAGFSAVALLRPTEGESNYLLSLAFDDQSFQQQWVATDIHQQVWPQMEQHCARYSLKRYNTV
ncbi:MAG TPA: antibiotic biosynthesis monooxygenase family protein [Terriglobia bacterium]|nr:antibiotic biosynthesis monooxygenase family protein [Terriglobia bacterium]